jgi:hypothetical protein
MIIKDRQHRDIFHELKIKVYRVVKTLNSTFISSSVSVVYLLLVYMLMVLPFVSILFKHHDHFPQQVSQGKHLAMQL